MKHAASIALAALCAIAITACTAQEQNQTKQQVQQAVHSVPSPVKQGVSDAALTAAVEGAIAAQSGVNVFHIGSTAHDGVVTLKGTVPSEAVRSTVLTTVRGVRGVTSIVDQLVVRK